MAAEPVSSWSTSDWLILSLAPWLTFIVAGFPFAVASVHFKSNDWPLWHLGFITLAGFGCRNMINALVASRGPWLVAPMTLTAASLMIPAAVWPESEAVVLVSLFGVWTLHPEMALQALCYSRFMEDHSKLQEASRTQSLCGTVGYALSPFISGVVFDFGGWRLTAACQAAAEICLNMVVWTSPLVRKDWQRWKETAKVDVQPALRRSGTFLGNLPKRVLVPGLFVALANFGSNWSYMCEWMTFAIYFRDEHNWTNTSAAGFFQMIGDVVGAFLLVAAAKLRARYGRDDSSRMSCRMFDHPHHLSWLLALWFLLNLGLTMSDLILAVISQTVMGTVYVFFIQYVNEMNMSLAQGDSATYLSLQFFSQVGFGIGNSAGGYVSLAMYESLGRLVPFYVASGISLCCMLSYASFFILRGLSRPVEGRGIGVLPCAEDQEPEESPKMSSAYGQPACTQPTTSQPLCCRTRCMLGL